MGKRKKGKGKGKGKGPAKSKKGSAKSDPSAKPAESAEAAESEPEEPDDPDTSEAPAKPDSPKKKPATARVKNDDTKEEEPEAATLPGFGGFIQRLDEMLSKVELVAVGFFVISLTLVATYQFVVVTLLKGKASWADEMIRFLVFFTAMSAAALAAQQRRMMAIDIVPRLLSPKIRVVTRIFIALLVVFVCYMLIKAGHANRLSELKKQETGGHLISTPTAMLALPIGAAFIGLHFLFQAIIDSLFLASGKLPPEPEEAVH